MVNWPNRDAVSLSNFYGQPWKVTSDGIVLDPLFERAHITRIPAAFDMWMGEAKIMRLAVNKKIAEPLSRILERIAKETSAKERREFGIDEYGGGFNFRPIRGNGGKLTVNKLSLHSYGAAVDFSPTLNPIEKPYNPSAKMMPHEIIEIFKSEGAFWGGDFRTRPDCQHFEFTR